MEKRVQIRDYRIKVNLRCRNKLERWVKGYPVIFRGFNKYKFAVHRQLENKDVWRVTELSSGLAFRSRGLSRLEVAKKTYKILVKNEDKFKRIVQEYARMRY